MSQKQSVAPESLTTKVLPCTCAHPFQDKQYGQGKRLHSPCAKNPETVRCSVCGTIRARGGPTVFKSATKKSASCGGKKAGLKASGKQGRKGKKRS